MLEENLPNQDNYFSKLHWTKKLVFHSDDKSLLKSALVLPEQGEDEEENLYNYRIMLYRRSMFEPQQFSGLLSYLPNLKEIDLQKSSYYDTYMGLLPGLDTTIYLKRLEMIVIKGHDEDRGVHFATYYNFSSTLTHISINCFKEATLNGRTGDVFLFLRDFESLSHMKYFNKHWHGEEMTVYDLSSSCPKLGSLQFYNGQVDVSDTRLDTTFGELKEQDTTPSIINNHLEKLTVVLPTLSTKYIELITKYLSTKLKSLSIVLETISMYVWSEQVVWDSALTLHQHMKSIPNVVISFGGKKENNAVSTRGDESKMTNSTNSLVL